MKKIFLAIIVAVLALVPIGVSSYYADTDAVKISGSNVNAKPGDTVEVPIVIEKNEGFCGLNLYFTYSNELTFVSLTNKVSSLTCTNGVTTVWDGADNYTGTGNLAVLKFTIPENAVYGAVYEIKINFIEAYDIDLNNVSVGVTSGSITIVCPHTNTTNKPAVPADCDDIGYTAGVFCEDCDTYISGHQEVPATGVHVDANGKWESDGTSHYHTCECGVKFDTATHTGGTANCKNKAVCSVCSTAYGNVNSSKHDHTEVRNKSNASCNTDGYTGDTYCTDCGVKIATGQRIPATGAHVDANGKWESDGTNHYHTCTCGTKFDTATHNGGTANCKNKAVCSVCNTAYGNVNSSKHDHTEVRDKSNASCNTDGYTGDTYCTDCGVKTATGQVIKATGAHVDANDKWESDGTNHYHTCACGTKFDVTAHTGGAATCVSKAKCSICGTAYGNVDSSKHGKTEVRDAKEATCVKEGYTGDTYCKDCGVKTATGSVIPETGKHKDADGKWESDGTKHFHTCDCGEKIDAADHKGGTASCSDKAKCSVCGTAYGELDSDNHVKTEIRGAVKPTCTKDGYTGDTYCKDCNTKLATGTVVLATGEHVDADDKWESDGANHFHTCGCGATFDIVVHTGGNANCTDKAQCEVCGTAYGELDASKHKETEVRDVVEATCDKNGYSGDTYCKSCGVKTETGSVTLATGVHSYGDWVTTKEPTTKETGTREQKCTVCGHVVTEVVPVLAPEPVNNVLPIIVGIVVVACGGASFFYLKRKSKH